MQINYAYKLRRYVYIRDPFNSKKKTLKSPAKIVPVQSALMICTSNMNYANVLFVSCDCVEYVIAVGFIVVLVSARNGYIYGFRVLWDAATFSSAIMLERAVCK